MTKVEVKLIPDPDMYTFLKEAREAQVFTFL